MPQFKAVIKEKFINNQTQEEYESEMESFETIDELTDDEPINVELTKEGKMTMVEEADKAMKKATRFIQHIKDNHPEIYEETIDVLEGEDSEVHNT